MPSATLSGMPNRTLSAVVRALASDPDAAAAAMALLGRAAGVPTGSHLDEEALAAVLEGPLEAAAAAHLLECPACASRLEALAPMLAIGVLPGLAQGAPWLPEPRAAIFATVRLRRDGGVDVLEATGPTRIGAPIELRSGAPTTPALVGLRDAAEHPAFELGIVREAVDDRVTLVVSWLARGVEPLLVRVRAGGRTIAEVGLVDRCAHVPAIRADTLRLEVRDAERALGVAWLALEAP